MRFIYDTDTGKSTVILEPNKAGALEDPQEKEFWKRWLAKEMNGKSDKELATA